MWNQEKHDINLADENRNLLTSLKRSLTWIYPPRLFDSFSIYHKSYIKYIEKQHLKKSVICLVFQVLCRAKSKSAWGTVSQQLTNIAEWPSVHVFVPKTFLLTSFSPVAAALTLRPPAPSRDVETAPDVSEYQPHLHLPKQRNHYLWWAERNLCFLKRQ